MRLTMSVKRDIFKINSDQPTALNLEHVTMITLQDKRITLSFQNNGVNVDLENEEVAKNTFELLLKKWAGDVQE